MHYSTIEEALQALRRGEIIMVLDDKDRENEGDLVCAGEFASPENINFMATYAKGLICQPISQEIADRLGLAMMVNDNTDPHGTAFTVSVDHIETGTGISAYDRSLTSIAITDEASQPEDFRRPGHVFPLVAKEGGVLERPGHTEATVDLMKLAGLKASGICVEIMADDGHMMREKDLLKMAQKWNIPVITIKDLQDYRIKNEKILEKVAQAKLPTTYGEFVINVYEDKINDQLHLALIMGDLSGQEDVLCRIHSKCITGDVFGSLRCDCGDQLSYALKAIQEKGQGVLIYLNQEGRGIGLVNKIKAYALQEEGVDTLEANLKLGLPADCRKYYSASQILEDLGVESVNLLTNNPDKIDQITSCGVKVNTRLQCEIPSNQYNHDYLETKKDRMGHLLTKV